LKSRDLCQLLVPYDLSAQCKYFSGKMSINPHFKSFEVTAAISKKKGIIVIILLKMMAMK
jgi:hypothetical protein